ncbi:MAG: transposase [Bryobacterales bacterium]|nr:transposase [Bryobacterales bacterium]
MSLQDTLSQYWLSFQRGLFPWLAEELGPLSERHKRLVQVMEFVRVEELLPGTRGGGAGRPPESRAALARAFLAKAVFAVPTTRALVERLRNDPTLRRLCGWQSVGARAAGA